MADGELTLKFSDEDLLRLQADADAAGVPVADYARELLLRRRDYADYAEDERILAEYDRTGVGHTVEEAIAYFRQCLDEHVSKNQ